MVAFRTEDGVTIKWLKFHQGKGIVVGIQENKAELDHVVTLHCEEIDTGMLARLPGGERRDDY
jgi:hypothetical protein